MKTVFISRHLDPASPLKRGLGKAGCRIIDQSLVSIAGIRYARVPACDWVFFSGKNAIRYLLSDTPQLSRHVRYAVMGRGSQLELRKYGIQADFVGAGNDAARIGRAFANLITDEKVLFVSGLDTPQTVQRQMPITCSWRNLYVYKNEPKSETVPYADVLIFTSPNNVAAYFSQNIVYASQRVIAIGTTTLQALIDRGVTRAYLPADFYERRLLSCVLPLLKKPPERKSVSASDTGSDRAA